MDGALSQVESRVVSDRKVEADSIVARVGVSAIILFLAVSVLLPLYFFLSKSVENEAREFVGIANYLEFFRSPGLVGSIKNSFFVAGLSTLITVPLAFIYAYALTRSCMRLKSTFRIVALVPMLGPTLLPAISLVYFFGTQGIAKELLFGYEIYGPIGIIMGEVYQTFPHAFLILFTALSLSDGRLYEAALAMRSGPLRTFITVTLPGVKYGLLSATFVTFSLTITDFGVPKVIGGGYTVLATDIYKNVVGMQDMEMAAVVGVVLLAPACTAFAVDRIVHGKQVALLTSRATPYEPKPKTGFDLAMLGYCAMIALIILSVVGMAAYASVVKFWPYNLDLTLQHFRFGETTDQGWGVYANSLMLAVNTAVFGTVTVFVGAYFVEKTRVFNAGRGAIQFLAMIPMAVPGMVLGLAYIFFFNHPENPLGFLYGSLTLMVICTIAHFYTVSHLTAVTALKQIDSEFESVAQSLKVSLISTFRRVTVPICLPAIFDISIYLFINAMTTVSAIIFIFWPGTITASIQMLFQDDNGNLPGAAALGILIFLTTTTVRIAHWFVSERILLKTQRWRQR